MGINKKLLILGSFIFLILIVSASVISPEAIKKELEVIHFDVVEKQASLDLVNKKLKNTPKEIVSTKLIRPKQVDAQMMAMLNDLKAQMAEKLTIYREKHPVIKSLQSRIDYLQRLIDSQKTKKDMERKISLNPEFSDLTQKKNQLETQIKGLLARKMELQKVLKKIDIENEKKNDIKENDKEKNTKKSGSKISFNFLKNRKLVVVLKVLIVFLIFTVLISMLYIILKKHATKINSYINRLKENILKKMKTKNITIKKVKKIEDPDIIAKISKVKNTEPYDITLIDREGPYNTVFKKIAETIRNSTGSFIITPFKDGAGSTFLAVNLSNIFAREGERVLIIDSNFQEPMLHRIYSVENEKGFSDVLEGKDPKELIQKTDNRLIDVLSSGLNPLGVGELFENTLFLEFISEMEKEYSRIIIDMPSIDKSELPYIAGKFVPYIVVVNKEEHVEVCRSNAESKNNVFLGCILNKN